MEIILLQNTIVGRKRHTAGEAVTVDDETGKKMIAAALAWSEQPKQPEKPESETEKPESEPEKPKATSKKAATGAKK